MEEKWDEMSNEELCLEYQQSNDNYLFEYFLNRNKNLIWYFTKFLARRHPSHIDILEQCGRSAMWEAMLKYEQDKGAKFSTYYYWHVLKNLRDFYEEILDIRLPAYVRERLKQFKEDHKEDNFVFNTVSIHTAIGNNRDTEETLEDIIAAEDNIEADMEAKATREELLAYARRLDARSCACIIDYFGLLDGIPKTLQVLGDKHNVTRERIRQIISKGLKKIRIWYKKDHLVD